MERTSFPLQGNFAHEFAEEWADAFNSHDLERILSHYDEDVILVSPVAVNLMGGDGAIRGKAALRDYFRRGLDTWPDLRFHLVDVLWGLETIVVFYTNNVHGSRTAEVMLLNDDRRITRVWANYDR